MSNSSKRTIKTDAAAYVDLKGQAWNLQTCDDEERALIAKLRRRATRTADWFAFDNEWMKDVAELYAPRGLSRRQMIDSPVFRIAQDLSGRIALANGYARAGDYRDDLELLINTRFKNRRDFCRTTGLTEDMLSHVLAGRKDLSIETLANVLGKIGYGVRIVPLQPVDRAS